MTGPHILMIEPGGFEVSYAINPWMRPADWARDPSTGAAAARRAFEDLRRSLEAAGAEVTTAPGAPGQPDMVFPANAAVVLAGRALLSRFRPAERRGEEPAFRRIFADLARRGLIRAWSELPEGCFQEGAGDCIWDAARGHFWAGFGPRSDRRAADHIERFFGRDVIALELATDRFYHLDTCFCPLPGGEVLYYPAAFTPAARATIRACVAPDQLIAATDAEAAGLCVNAVALGRKLVMAKAPPSLPARLAARGYEVAEVDLAPFLLAGGAAFCMTLRLDLDPAPAPVLA